MFGNTRLRNPRITLEPGTFNIAQPAQPTRPTQPSQPFQPMQPFQPVQPAQPTQPAPVTPAFTPNIPIRDIVGNINVRPDVFRPDLLPPVVFPFPPVQPPAEVDEYIPRFSGTHTTTRLINYAISFLENLPAEALRSAMNFIQAKPRKVEPGELLEELRQRTNFNEILQETAEGWSERTRGVFAEVFAMPATEQTAMDAIVSIALLNRPDLEQVLRRENAAPPTVQDLLENRKIVWQYPAPGTPLTPPYVIIVAVENVDTGPAEDVVQRIMSMLVATASGYRLPRGAAQKLG